MARSEDCRWRFPLGGFGEVKGINDAGVEMFNSNSLRSLVRETLQNSLDASKGGPVLVEFEEYSVPFTAVPDSDGLRDEILHCAVSGGDDSPAAQSFLKHAIRIANRRSVRVMRISDYGTTGLRGATTCETGTDWSRLIKESGSSSKGGSSGGSFGIGKYSSFACSDLRTVFFSSLDDEGVSSHIGVSRLISALDKATGQHTTGIGYYSATDRNVAVMGQLSIGDVGERDPGDSGTDIFILGFRNEGDRQQVTADVIKYVLMDFLVSVWKGKLTVSVNGTEVNRHSLATHVGHLNEFDEDPLVKETIEHFDMLTAKDDSTKVIVFDPDDMRGVRKYKKLGWRKGDCTLYIKRGDDTLNREVTITRAAGMRIFNQNRISGSIRFTGILMIEGDKMNADFKAMEAPSHDEWSAERARDPKLAKQMITALRMWVKDTVNETFKVKVDDQVEAFGTALYLPRRESEDDGEGQQTEEVLVPQIKELKQRNITPKKEDRVVAIRTGVTPDPDGDAVRKGKGKAKGKEPRRGSAPGDDPGFTRVPIRQRLVCTDRETGRYRLTFTVPHDASRFRILLSIQGEQGEEQVEVRSASAFAGTPRSATYEGNGITVDDVKAGARAQVDFTTDFPYYCMMGADYYEAK